AGSAAELAEKVVAGSAVSGLGQATAVNLQAANLQRQQGKDTPATRSSFPYSSACPPRRRASPANPIAFFLLRFVAGIWPLPLFVPRRPFSHEGCAVVVYFLQSFGLTDRQRAGWPSKGTKFFTPYQKAQQHFACSDTRVVEDQWKNLVQIWSSQEFKKRSETNKQNKSKHTFFHGAGSKNFVDIYHEEFLKTGATLDHGDLFIRTRMKKAGGPVNDESAAMISFASVCHAQKKKDSLAGRRVRILNFSGEVVVSGILMSDDNDNMVMGKKLGETDFETELMSVAKSVSVALFSPATNLSLPPFPPVDPTPTFPSPFPLIAEELAAAAAATAVDSGCHRRHHRRRRDPPHLQPLWTTSSPLPCGAPSPATPASPSPGLGNNTGDYQGLASALKSWGIPSVVVASISRLD
ncbi:hypothetical protein Taro_040121, partial [Colocasia esculenta]|nr:hypothetical protein [Colocasia esculenta]